MSLELSKIDATVLSEILQNMGADENKCSLETADAGLLSELRISSPEEALEKWLRWNGVIGFGPSIVRTLDQLRAAQERRIPVWAERDLRLFVDRGVVHGHFLGNLVRGDLKRTISYADESNRRLLPTYVEWLSTNAPAECWGSDKAVDDWRLKGGHQGEYGSSFYETGRLVDITA